MPVIESLNFSYIYLTPENIAYIRDGETKFGLSESEDLQDFKQAMGKAGKAPRTALSASRP
jgi:hypothetical protein